MSNAWKIIIGIIVVAIVVLAVYFGVRSNANPTPALPLAGEGAATTGTVPADTSTNAKPSANVKPMNYTQATFHTSLGDFTIALDTANTPNTVENFTKLVSSGFYNMTKFHRVIAGFMIQAGDPQSKDDSLADRWGTGGPGYTFADEIKSTNADVKGTIAMANAGPNTNGSQFFINVADNTYLNTKHTVFGHVTSGYDVVEKISSVQTGQNDRPVTPVVIESIALK
ncbi:MAG: peptidyl-prolyl cis-trans isomerase, peptidylprolyl isomerase [Patescibacteria group bacterium]|nr:peptidyl-prolyl cis-trans isomerase, peptidylprolyl isomerase [Patescibacteria group bacterium]